MTVTETRPSETTSDAYKAYDGRNGDAVALTDQIVLSSAAFAAQGLNTVGHLLDGCVTATDLLVSGVFDVADEIIGSSLMPEIAAKGSSAMRSSWTTLVTTLHQSIGQVAAA